MRASEARAYIEETASERANVREKVRKGEWLEAEPDPDRLMRYVERHLANTPGAEAIQGSTNDLTGTRYLVLGSAIRRAIGYVDCVTPTASTIGSGFLISPRLFITNQHVIPDAQAAAFATITFDREISEGGRPRPTTSYLLDPDALALFSDEDHLDYAVIAVGGRQSGTATLAELGYCALSNRKDKHIVGMPLNIIQHPSGLPKMIAIRNNLLTHRGGQGRTLLYETDTETGSSGSPVFNDDWEVVALHHWGAPHNEETDEFGQPLPAFVNEGIRISAIHDDLASRRANGDLTPAQRALLAEVLEAPPPTVNGADADKVLTPTPQGRPGGNHERLALQRFAASPSVTDSRSVAPFEITIRVGDRTFDGAPTVRALDVRPRMGRGAEAIKVDLNYNSRGGFDTTFIPGHEVPLPSLSATLTAQLAPLLPHLPDSAAGELKYEHFSVKLNAVTRIAIFTATNIDGTRYLHVDRDTGQVNGAEGDKWFPDPRVDPDSYLDQSFYSGWSTYFDRGHLTRRTDPTWGTETEAERANADTFHFTNCSPQHFRFNQTAEYWQGVERYVLENGVLDDGGNRPVCVLQGPIFDDAVDLYADDVQIPSRFWKIVAWKGNQGDLRCVGLVVDQLALLGEPRTFVGMPHDLPSVDVQQWRVSVPSIEARTGLDFGVALRNADTIARPDQPDAGREAAVPLRRYADIQL